MDGGDGVVGDGGVPGEGDPGRSQAGGAREGWHCALDALQVMDPGGREGIVSEDHDDPRGVAVGRNEDPKPGRGWLFAGAENTGDARPALDLRLQMRKVWVKSRRTDPGFLDEDGGGVEDAGREPLRGVLCGLLGRGALGQIADLAEPEPEIAKLTCSDREQGDARDRRHRGHRSTGHSVRDAVAPRGGGRRRVGASVGRRPRPVREAAEDREQCGQQRQRHHQRHGNRQCECGAEVSEERKAGDEQAEQAAAEDQAAGEDDRRELSGRRAHRARADLPRRLAACARPTGRRSSSR